MPGSKTAHEISVFIGTFFVLLSIYRAVFVPDVYFYTSFALGSWLVFDYIDYRLNNTSILTFFYNSRHKVAFYIFLLVSFVFCFIVDYWWGVKVLQVWEWRNYRFVEFLRMYLIMNASFVLGMYEFYRIVKTLLKSKIPDSNLLNFRYPRGTKLFIYIFLLLLGILFLIMPVYIFALDIYHFREYIMLFPFLSITLISDSITYLTGGQTVLESLLRLNKLKVVSLLLIVVIAFIFTEGLNLFAKEWKYIRMPFHHIQIYSVPLAVLIGWIPLVVGCVSMVNLARHFGERRIGVGR